ncbi:protein HEADING DATE REPRESSOR 1 isoform X2 [Raphanus sativus]|uniref:Protein HEADING DATE REPRESSOR 1 isoform X2 n=1 Tax=Raphanus sativus TaxID=3726 RepID=A0A9W3C4E0_RAPSA|nr:protein HEADING DATE REPRESSOR 1 isoform X2 [Raphanus sativus]
MEKGNGFEGENKKKKTVGDGFVGGFFPVSTTKIAWKSRKRSASANQDKALEAAMEVTPEKDETTAMETEKVGEPMTTTPPVLSEKRKALFEPLEPITNLNGKRPTDADSLLPPPDFESANYPKGWLIGSRDRWVKRAARRGLTLLRASATSAATREKQENRDRKREYNVERASRYACQHDTSR